MQVFIAYLLHLIAFIITILSTHYTAKHISFLSPARTTSPARHGVHPLTRSPAQGKRGLKGDYRGIIGDKGYMFALSII